ncbi:MAG: hypothetical protein F4194_02285 [Acidimicrobiia bacterium]|nr:hypothetical protein [Acidimicrobiia bacterium]MYK55399.1 hypothetical protein [Acidimicrobiia bacterium]
MAAFLRSPVPLLIRSLVLMAVPSLVLLVWQSAESLRETNPLFFWFYLLIWLGGFFVTGYAGWPLARTALSAVSPDHVPAEDDWWVRDGFVRTTAVFCFTVAVGTVFLVVPAILVLMIYSLYPFVIVDKKAKGFGSLAISSELGKGNRMPLLVLMLAALLFFAPAIVLFFQIAGPPGILALWVLGTPALSLVATIMAAAYRILTSP